MAPKDFFSDPEPEAPPEVPVEPETPPKLKIGDEEFDPEEAKSLIELGKIGREAEEKFNTKIDKVWPEYNKATQELKKIREEREAEERHQLDQKKQSGEVLSEQDQIKVAREQAKKLGLVTADDFDNYYVQRREAEKLLDSCQGLEKEITGKDGRPVFKTQEILKYMDETGIRDPNKAYRIKYEPEIERWREEQLSKARGRGLVTEESSSAGSKQAPEVKITRSNFDAMMKEALEGNI